MTVQTEQEVALGPERQYRRLKRRSMTRRGRLARTVLAMTVIVAVWAGLFVFRDAIWGPKFNHSGYALSRDGQSPYIGKYVVPLSDTTWGETGEDNVLITRLHGTAVYHPVNSAWYINQMISSYKESKNKEYLDRAIATSKYLIKWSVTDEKGALWFPYRFSHDVKTLRLGTPWHSGMAQGMMLSTFVNLYDVTGDMYWKNVAARTVETFDRPKSATDPWFRNEKLLDGRKFIYFEEYPALDDAQNAHVVNGDIYALFGLYDYYRITGDKHAKWLFDVGASSIRDSFGAYRNPGKPSWYSTTFYGRTVWGNPKGYHKGVINQLRTLAKITGDSQFNDQANILFGDYHES